ncbi:MAG TPA: helix-turn-helix transcriptional regulator [Acidobacteriaceae bacterium]
MPRESLGELEQLALLATIRLGSEAYGTTIREEIEEQTGRSIAIGSLYKALDRLGEKGFVESEIGDSTPERGGRAKRFFSVTISGKSALSQSLETIQKMSAGMGLTPEAL